MATLMALLTLPAFWSFLANFLSLGATLIMHFFADKAAADAADQKFKVDQASFKAMVEKAIQSQQASQPGQGNTPGGAWDQTDPHAGPAPAPGAHPAAKS
jgi:hypothetical protein